MVNETGSDTALWHLQQAAICDLIARRQERHGFYREAEELHDRAQKHRDRAYAVDHDNRSDAA